MHDALAARSMRWTELVTGRCLLGSAQPWIEDLVPLALGGNGHRETIPDYVVRLEEACFKEFGTWSQRSLVGKRYVYLWADGVVRHEALQNRAG